MVSSIVPGIDNFLKIIMASQISNGVWRQSSTSVLRKEETSRRAGLNKKTVLRAGKLTLWVK